MTKKSWLDSVKNRVRSRSSAPGQNAPVGSFTGVPQVTEPSVNATQAIEPLANALKSEGIRSISALSDPYGIAREKYGLFRLAAPTASSLSEDSSLDTNHIDIVAVHGLNGTADKTWTDEDNNFFWLEDLVNDFPGARVFTYGYASEVKFTLGTGDIEAFARSLLEALKAERVSKKDQARRIIFICHSMGGIVVKKALIIAKNEDLLYDNTRKSVVGIAFLSTPHRGSSQTELPLVLANIANVVLSGVGRYVGSMRSDLIKSLEKDSMGLKDISTNFRDQTENMKIASFYELKTTPPVNKLIVDKISGIMDVARERIIPMPGCDHRTICRFPRRDSNGYKTVLGVLREWVSVINEAENVPISSEDLACLRSLSFQEINYRRQEADQAYQNTCAWILKHPVYAEWLDKKCELLWIQGSPGSGKSTLVSFIYEEFQKNISLSREVVLDYFFHSRGSILQKTRVGMFRTLLHQLYDQVHFIRPKIQMIFKEKDRFGNAGAGWEWHPKECERLFSEVIVSAAQLKNITLFVDALDEAGSDGIELASYFHELNAKLRAGHCNARICISCRKYPVIAPNVSLKVYVEKENGGDIQTYVEQKFGSEIQSHGMAMSAQGEFKKLQMVVVERSQNTFQWASLVVPLIIKLRRDGQSLAYIMKELDKVPRGLHEVYEHILTKAIEFQYRPKTLLLMQWVCLAKTPLTVGDIRFAMAAGFCIDERQESSSNLKDFVESDEDVDTLITSMSGGLVETIHRKHDKYTDTVSFSPTSDIYSSRVQFIHQSVNDFLLSDGLRLLAQLPSPTSWRENELTSSADSIIGESHDRLCKLCINYIKFGKVFHAYEAVYYKGKPFPPFKEYARTYWIFHAERADSYEVSQQHLIQRLGLRPYPVFFDRMISNVMTQVYPLNYPAMSLLHIASLANLASVVAQILETDPCMVNDLDHLGSKPVQYAASSGHCKLVEVLLNAEDLVGANSKDTAGDIFMHAAMQGNEQVVKLLLGRGVDLHNDTRMAGDALIAAVWLTSQEVFTTLPWGESKRVSTMGDVSLIKLLLGHGANANARGTGNHTAIEEAIASTIAHTRAVELLLESGANANSNLSFASPRRKQLMEWLSSPQVLLSDNNSLDKHPEPDGTVLQHAAALKDKNNATMVTKLLLEKGAQVNGEGSYGTALQIASARGNLSVVKLLLEKGAKVDGLWIASTQCNAVVVELLIERGANNTEFGETIVEVLRRLQLLKSYLYDSDTDLHSLAGSLDTASPNDNDNGNDVNDDDNSNAKANEDV
ncbi:hypothetical protein VE01_05769 [Pseudogymnoascus verrucosus]|uniref:Uncharacterized protein n=1 Tax=Pseudogymnoascus verrucosus TaxID=342668 RepID=A0A1B8GK95_9PEZI|nr:uncharacterized protein VE01_05769 [Pseudogymnoascus verrucosus]OBT96248.1 hypothetical protein VE01_05769 [Pseudogymnoascus verrucosus]